MPRCTAASRRVSGPRAARKESALELEPLTSPGHACNIHPRLSGVNYGLMLFSFANCRLLA